MFRAIFVSVPPERRGWRIYRDNHDICGAVDEAVARATAAAMNELRGL